MTGKIGDFVTKDSGARAEYDSGMVRDTEEGKARFDLLLPLGVPYEAQLLTRFAELLARGAKKYTQRNWEKANGQAELDRYRSSALRHLQQWASPSADGPDEDHAAAVMFNLLAYETTAYKIHLAAADTVIAAAWNGSGTLTNFPSAEDIAAGQAIRAQVLADGRAEELAEREPLPETTARATRHDHDCEMTDCWHLTSRLPVDCDALGCRPLPIAKLR